ncbi:MAG: transposase family protein, partial [Alistipes sp.]
MELIDIMRSFLPRDVVELFEIVKIDDNPSEWLMDIYLDERKVVPKNLANMPVISYGFVEAVTIQDFPIRGKRVYLHLRRRKWLNKSDNTIHTTHFDITYPGTQLTEELVAFLKATN